MSLYRTDEFSFDLPERLLDRSLNIFALSEAGPSDFSIVISRIVVPAPVTLADQFTALINELSKKLPNFQLIDQLERTLSDGMPAGEIRYSYTQNGVFLIQRQVGMLRPIRPRVGLRWTAITASFGPKPMSAWHKSFDELIESITFTKD